MAISYVFVGLGQFLERLIIRDARLLRLPNPYGIRKVLRNILALQQSTKTWTNHQEGHVFERAKQYYSLYYISPQVRNKGCRCMHQIILDRKCWMAFAKTNLLALMNIRPC